MDFMRISVSAKKGVLEVRPKFIVNNRSSDLMIRGGDFYAIWQGDEIGLWSTDEQDALDIIDAEIDKYVKENYTGYLGGIDIKYIRDADSGVIDAWHKYCQRQLRDNFHTLDEKLVFANMPLSKKDYVSKVLPYPLEECDISGYETLISTLYSPEERRKIEWAIGSIINGDSRKIQKFLVLYGAQGTGKSTILNIIQKLFDGFWESFDAKALGSGSNQFALEAFQSNPLVAIQHDGDLSRIEDNTRLNSLVSHEAMNVNVKYKSGYSQRFKSFLFMGTNKPVKITDSRSGILRRLIDVSPTGNILDSKDYRAAMKKIDFELGGIALHCKEVYESDPDYYDDYVPIGMMGASNDFFNYMCDMYDIFQKNNETTLISAWQAYKTFCDDAQVNYPLPRRLFVEELKNYFEEFIDRDSDGRRNVFRTFKTYLFDSGGGKKKTRVAKKDLIEFKDYKESLLDKVLENCKAQLANEDGIPGKQWGRVRTTLKDIDTRKLHYVQLPLNHIVIDFDIPDENGEKSFEKNLYEASKWPPTYAELSKSGAGIHLHYIYVGGDPEKLSRVYSDHIEIKVNVGNSSLRRCLTKCNNLPVATIASGLPLKEGDKTNFEGVKSEQALRTLILRNLNKEYHDSTVCSIQFIYKILDDAYQSGMTYDVRNMHGAVLAFAGQSTHQSQLCVKMVADMKFCSKDILEKANESEAMPTDILKDERPITFFDIEVFPNLVLVCYMVDGTDEVIGVFNPDSKWVQNFIEKYRLVGFNCRRYDNHILYAILIGYSTSQIFELSGKIVSGDNPNSMFGQAYDISYTDIYDYAKTKQSLKKWEISLGIHHQECPYRWDEPVPEDKWSYILDYCKNDVKATKAVWDKTKGDFLAREILASLAGGKVNDTTNSLTTKIIFGKERHPALVYSDISKEFPGYEYIDALHSEDKKPHNMYKGIDVGFGGLVLAEPGMYRNVKCFDVSGMHPASIRALNLFGTYTKNFGDIVDARLAIKHKDFAKARTMLDGKLAPFLDDEEQAENLSGALKIAVNSVYGLTSASFDNPFKDRRNVNNIVALRGALFMINLKEEVEKRGFKVIHIKTDSIKIVDPTEELAKFIDEFGKQYGYLFEVEHSFDRICLVNNAVYIGYLAADDPKKPNKWVATGAQFAVPYVFKALFSHEPIEFEDMCVVNSVNGSLYLDYNENLDSSKSEEITKVLQERRLLKMTTDHKPSKNAAILLEKYSEYSDEELHKMDEAAHCRAFVGRVGEFCPMRDGVNAGILLREKDGKYSAVSGSKGYRWFESEVVKSLGYEEDINLDYFRKLVDEAVDEISKFGDFEAFVSI